MADLIDLSKFTRVKKGRAEVSHTNVLRKNDHRGVSGTPDLGFEAWSDYRKPSKTNNIVTFFPKEEVIARVLVKFGDTVKRRDLRNQGYTICRVDEKDGEYVIYGYRQPKK